MECSAIEQRLSEYVERSLPAKEIQLVKNHIDGCSACSALVAGMESVLTMCRSYPVLELSPDQIEKVLLRTSGRPRTKSFREKMDEYFLRPFLNPKFAFGSALTALFLVLTINLMLPRFSTTISNLSSQGVLQFLDQSVQQLYGEGLKAYEKKNEWQAKLSRFKSNTWHSIRAIKEQMDEPVEGRRKQDGETQKEQAPKDKSSSLLSSAV